MDPAPTIQENRSFEKPSVLPVLVLTGFLLIGLALRVAYIRLIDTPPFSDMADYENMALNLLDGRGLSMDTSHLTYRAYRPPAYPVFIAAVYRFLGKEPVFVREVQCFLSVLTVVLVYGLGKELFSQGDGQRSGGGRWVGLAAAGFLAFDEASIFFTGQLLSETLFIFLMVLWSYLLVRSSSRPHVGMGTLLGLIGGVTILVRPLFGPILLFGAYWYFRRAQVACKPPPSDWKKFSFIESPYAPPLALVIYAGMIVSLWGLRNYAVVGSFIPTSTNGGVNFYLGHHEDFGYESFGNKEGIRRFLRARGIDSEVAESEIFTLQALQFIREHPLQDFRNNLKKIYYLYLAPASWRTAFLPWKWWNYLESPYRPWPWEINRRKLRFWRVFDERGGEELPTHRDWFWREGRLPLVNWGWPVIYLTVAGILLAVRRRERLGFPLGLLLVYTLTLMVFFANARFRTPILPFLYLFTAYALVAGIGRLTGRRLATQPEAENSLSHAEIEAEVSTPSLEDPSPIEAETKLSGLARPHDPPRSASD